VAIGVAFLSCADKLFAPSHWVCAPAVVAIVPSMSIPAVNVTVSFLMRPSALLEQAFHFGGSCHTRTLKRIAGLQCEELHQEREERDVCDDTLETVRGLAAKV
jgi:hypothetical protein